MPDADFPLTAYALTCAGVCVCFALVWVFCRRRDNWSIIDAAWAATPALFALVPLALASGSPRSWVQFALLALWGGRLALHLHTRVGGGRDREDARYADMRTRWGDDAPRLMFGFFQIQAVTVWVLLLPAFLAASDTSPYPQFHDIAGALLVLGGIAGESAADASLKKFRADPANRGRLCEAGLWAYSRHPNYFFEWIVWIGFAVAALGAPAGFIALLAPAMMYALLRHFSGVPVAEERAARLKGDAWRDYAARVNTFFPGPRRNNRDH